MVFIWLERQSLGQGFRVRVQVFTDLEASMRLWLSGLSWEIFPKILALFQCAGMSGKHHNGAEGGGFCADSVSQVQDGLYHLYHVSCFHALPEGSNASVLFAFRVLVPCYGALTVGHGL